MMRSRTWVAALGLALCAQAAWAQVELSNDGFAGGVARFQAGFVPGEAGAVRLSSPYAATKLERVQLLFGGGDGGSVVTLRVWDDNALTTDPGAVLYSGAFQVTASGTAMQELDVSAAGILVPDSFRVGIELSQAGLPSLAVDDDGTITADRNFVYASTAPGQFSWYPASTLGLTGDWIIRAVVSEADAGAPDAGLTDGGAPDAGGQDAGLPDGGAADAGGGDAGIPVGGCATDADCGGGTCDPVRKACAVDSGMRCGCSTAGGVLALLLPWALLLRRRRQR